jgi:hypothetical protein
MGMANATAVSGRVIAIHATQLATTTSHRRDLDPRHSRSAHQADLLARMHVHRRIVEDHTHAAAQRDIGDPQHGVPPTASKCRTGTTGRPPSKLKMRMPIEGKRSVS